MNENIPKHDPDLIIPNKNSLPYPVQVGDQKITLFDNTPFRNRGVIELEHYYTTKIFEVQKEYEKLVEDFNINKRVYASKFSFEPVVGHIYHLYENIFGEEFLSMISPSEWHLKYLGSFKLTSDKRWETVNIDY
jgi:hypothetical protein